MSDKFKFISLVVFFKLLVKKVRVKISYFKNIVNPTSTPLTKATKISVLVMASFVMKSELLSEDWMLGERMMLKEEVLEDKVRKVEDKVVDEARKVTGIPKPSFFLNLVAIEGRQKCPAPKRKAKKAPNFPVFAVSKRRLHLEEEEEVDMVGLKKLREDLLEEEMEQLEILLTKMHPSSKL